MPRWAGRHHEHCEHSRAAAMKQINAFPLIVMLIVVVLLIAWFGVYLP